MRSVVVVLPASMCAMMPMFLTRLKGVFLATDTAMLARSSPPVMRERPVCLGHPVGVIPALDARADVIFSVQYLAGQPPAHRLLAPRPGVVDHPPQGQRIRTARYNLDRHLVGGAAHPAAPDFQARPD